MRATRGLLCVVIALTGLMLGACTLTETDARPAPTPIRTVAPPPAPTRPPPESSNVPLDTVPDVVAEVPVEGIAEGLALSPDTEELWVATGTGVAAIEVRTNRVVDDVDVDGAPGAIRVDAVDGRVYVGVHTEGPPKVVVIDATTHEVVDSFWFEGMTDVGRIAVDASRNRLWASVANTAGASGSDKENVKKERVAVVDTNTHQLVGLIPVGPRPWGVGVDAGRGVAFVSDSQGIATVDAASLAIVDRFSLGFHRGVRGQGSLTVDEEAGRLFAVNEARGTVTVVDTLTRELIRIIDCGGYGPFDVALDTAADRAYITGCRRGAVAVVDLETLTVTTMLRHSDATAGADLTLGSFVEVDPSTGFVYLSGEDGRVTVIDGGASGTP